MVVLHFRPLQRLFPHRRNNLYVLFYLFLSCFFFSCSTDRLDKDYTILEVDTFGHIHDIGFLNDSIGYVTGGDTWDSGFVGKTLDGGMSWTFDSLAPKMMMCMDIENGQGIISGFEGLVYNLDQENWAKQNINNNAFIRDIESINDSTTIVVSGLAYRFGKILKFTKSTGARSVWTDIEDNPELSAIAQLSDEILVAVGYGKILRSTDQGESWNSIDQDGDFFKDVLFIDDQIGFVIGYDGMILKTVDAGLTWKKVRTGGNLDAGDRLKSISLTANGELWVCGKSGLILFSEDQGLNWSKSKLDTDSDLNTIHFHDGYIYVGGQDLFFARIEE